MRFESSAVFSTVVALAATNKDATVGEAGVTGAVRVGGSTGATGGAAEARVAARLDECGTRTPDIGAEARVDLLAPTGMEGFLLDVRRDAHGRETGSDIPWSAY